MKHIPLLVSFLSAALFSSAVAQETHPHRHERPEKLGTVNFTTSCSPKAQKQFNYGEARTKKRCASFVQPRICSP